MAGKPLNLELSSVLIVALHVFVFLLKIFIKPLKAIDFVRPNSAAIKYSKCQTIKWAGYSNWAKRKLEPDV